VFAQAELFLCNLLMGDVALAAAKKTRLQVPCPSLPRKALVRGLAGIDRVVSSSSARGEEATAFWARGKGATAFWPWIIVNRSASAIYVDIFD
jgi:hypothetical protein